MFFRKKRTFFQKCVIFSLKTHYKCIQTPIWASGSKMTPFWGVYPSFWGSNPLGGGGFLGKPYYFWKRPPRRGGVPWPFFGVISLDFPITFEKVPPRTPFLGGTPIFGSKWPIFSGFYWKSWSILKKPSKNRPKTVFHCKYTQKPVFERHFHCKHTHFWKNWPILGGYPLWGVYTPQKNRQKRTLFKSSQSSYRAKSNQSSSNFMKPQSRALLTRILKEKIQFFRRLSLGKVAHTNFKGTPNFP